MWLNRVAVCLLGFSSLLMSQTTSAPAAPQEPAEASISGTAITSAGIPLKGAIVTAVNSDNPSQRFAATSDEEGRWEIKNLGPGRYFIHAHHNRFATQAFGGVAGSSYGAAVTVASGQQITNLQIKIFPAAAIVGHVTDTEGEPLLGVQVLIMRAINREGIRHFNYAPFTVTTNDLGEFRFGNLLPGEYFISSHEKTFVIPAGMKVQDPKNETYLPTFYPSTSDPQGASPIKLQAGDEFTASLTVQKAPTFQVSGSITAKKQNWTHLVLRSKNRDLTRTFNERTTSVEAGTTFTFPGVPAGEYILEASAFSYNDHMSHRSGAWVPVNVIGSDVNGLSVALSPYPEIRGTYRCECPAAKSAVSDHVLRLVPDSEEAFGAATSAEVSDGKFEFSDVEPGAYRVFPFDKSADHRYTNFYLKSMTANGQDLLRRGLQVTPGTNMFLDVVESSEGARLSGTVSDKDGKPIAGALLDIVPDARDEIHRYVGGLSDREGKFLIQGIPPGEYKVFPWLPESIPIVRGNFQPYRSATFTQVNDGKGQAVRLEEGMTKNLNVTAQVAE
jgi:protocatechuate 3,4-dioxygenase beta subunit